MAFSSFSNFGNGLSGLAAAGGLFGGIVTNGYNSHKAHDLAILQYNLQRKYAQFTGENAHQWEVSDLRKAGLNPVLSANSGQTYSTGSFGGSYGNAQNPVTSASDALNAALGVRTTFANLENMSANTQKQKTETSLLEEQTRTQTAITKLTNAQHDIAQIDKQLKNVDLKFAARQKLLQLRKDASFIAEINSNILKIGSERELIYNQMSLNNAEKALKNSQKWRNYRMPLGNKSGGVSGSIGVPKLLNADYHWSINK